MHEFESRLLFGELVRYGGTCTSDHGEGDRTTTVCGATTVNALVLCTPGTSSGCTFSIYWSGTIFIYPRFSSHMACRLLALWILIGLHSRLIIGAGTSTASATSSTLSSVGC